MKNSHFRVKKVKNGCLRKIAKMTFQNSQKIAIFYFLKCQK